MLECTQHSDNCFVTLTYSDEHLPALNSLTPKDLQNFLKRFRKKISPLLVRFYAVGEYGDTTQRPHYHLAIFGYPSCLHGGSRYTKTRKNCCEPCDTIRDAWGLGLVHVGTLTTNSAQYIAGYVTKKMTSKSDPRLNGRHPEFARMSLRPGIGADAMHEVASTLMTFNLDTLQGDVPSALRTGSRLLPLGRYLRRRLRKLVGKEEKAPASELAKMAASVLLMLENHEGAPVAPGYAQENLTQRIIDASAQKVLQVELRERIFKKRGNQ